MPTDQIKEKKTLVSANAPATPPEGVTILMGYRVIIFAICFALYLLLMVASFVVLVDVDLFNNLEITELASYWIIGLIGLFLIGIGIFAIYVIAIEGYPGTAREKLAHKMRPLVIYAVPWFVLLAVLGITRLFVFFTSFPLILVALSFCYAVFSFVPLLAVKNVTDETRIKNYIDAMARICTCMTFIGGGIALVVKFLLMAD